jgi:PKD repeat protein
MRLFFTTILFLTFGNISAQYNWKTFQPLLRDSFGISETIIENLKESSHYKDKNAGFEVIWLRQFINGTPVLGADLQLTIHKNGKLIKVQHALVNKHEESIQPKLAAQDAFDAAFKNLNLQQETAINIHKEDKKGRSSFELSHALIAPASLQLVFYKNTSNELILSYDIYLRPRKSKDYWNILVNARSGEIVKKRNLNLDCHFEFEGKIENNSTSFPDAQQLQADDGFSYRVIPFPIESPVHGPRALISNPSDDIASPFGWHDLDGEIGHETTNTSGNNVDAYDDIANLDAPGQFAEANENLQFDFNYTNLGDPLNNLNASITNLFYWNNSIHDFAFHYGFDEESGNFQFTNYTGQGGDFDQVQAQALDGSGTNNANFGTPPDGLNPQMQMYLWSVNNGLYLTVNSPSNVAGSYISAVSAFGPQTLPNPVTGTLVLYNDGSSNPTLGCNDPINDISGKIVLIDRGTCNFSLKAINASDAGAIGIIFINNQNGTPFTVGGIADISIPSIMISQEDGNLLKSNIAQNIQATINLTTEGNFFDSSFDSGVIAHEYGHGISNRFTGGPDNTDCLWNEEQAGEGWSDFMALVMTTTNENNGEQGRGIGNFLLGNTPSGEGIRPYRYSTNMTINPVTYDYVQQLSIPHGVGYVWCSMIWDLYWKMIEIYGFDDDLVTGNGGNNKAIKLVFDGMRLQPCGPGFVDARDAILLADELNFDGQNKCIIWEVFARRGLGYIADQGSSEDVFDGTENYDVPPECLQAPLANFSSNTQGLCEGQTVTFQDLSGPVVLSRNWTFVGGNPTTSTLPNPTIAYTSAGIYPVTLQVQTNLGPAETTLSSYVNVSPDFTVSATFIQPTPGDNNGRIILILPGSVLNYTYNWYDAGPSAGNKLLNQFAGTYPVSVTSNEGCTVDTFFTLVNATSINDLENADFQISPNPTSNTIKVSWENEAKPTSLQLYDLQGRVLMTKEILNTSFEILDMSNLASGVYSLQLSSKSGKRSFLVVKVDGN